MFRKISLKIFIILFCSAGTCLFADSFKSNSASVANRRTAIRYLQLTKQYESEGKWQEAESNARIGLAYDDSIADLWYLCAAAKMNLGHKRSEILPLVVKSLSEGEWVDYNKDGARILYADILVDTHKYEQAVSVLDEKPFIYSSDAEYIRARSFYNLGTPEGLEKARLKIDAARRVYPQDTRLADLFYKYEYVLFQKNGSIDPLAQRIADAFLASLASYRKKLPELELYASIFVKDKEKKSRILKSFNAQNNKSPLYPVLALEAGLMEEQAALDYFYTFSDKNVNLSVLKSFIKVLKKDESKKEFSEYLNSWNGTLEIDTDNDLLVNMTVVYNRGRPEKIVYDENQDDTYEWSADCDFGVPLKISLASGALNVIYGTWPFLQQVVYIDEESKTDITFELIAENLEWSPFEVTSAEDIKSFLGADFFVPAISKKYDRNISRAKLVNSALSYTMPSKEKKDAVISVSLLNGFAHHATYYSGDKVYAIAKFENGLPVLRSVDMDGDGLFETVEEYGYTKDSSQKFISRADELQVMTNLFGSPAEKTGIYVKSIKIDRNGDTIPDFTEEYTAGEGKISSWDLNADGAWDVRYVKLPSMIDGKLREESMFYEPLNNSVVTVMSENGIPVSVRHNDKLLNVMRGVDRNFYWISAVDSKKSEDLIIKKINQIQDQGVCIIVEDSDSRYLAVRIDKKIFAEKLPSKQVKK